MEDIKKDELLRVKLLVAKVLNENSWVPMHGDLLPYKKFQTAVGEKTASCHLSSGEFNYCLTGEYQSEGRNALEPHSQLIPKNSTDEDIERLVIKFSINADDAISQTYAANLHLRSRNKPGM